MDGQWKQRLAQRLSTLNCSLTIADAQGNDILTGRPMAGKALKRCEAFVDWYWMCPEDQTDVSPDVLALADALLSEMIRQSPEAMTVEGAYRQMLTETLDDWQLDEILSRFPISRKLPRHVLAMESAVDWHGAFFETMRAVLPAGETDVMVPMDGHTIAYLMDASAVDDHDDLLEFAYAAQESALSEAGCALRVGLGGCASDAAELHAAYARALRSLALGKRFMPGQSVFDDQRMLMQRFLSELPVALAEKYHELLFNTGTARLFTDELLDTVSLFFEKDLNLSDTARQLYIHRNTLTYRLDKIKKVTGLDLRTFDDAVTFKMLLEMKKCYSQMDARTPKGE